MSRGRVRLAQLPTVDEMVRFLRRLRGPTRLTAVRSVVDGAFVTWTLRRRGVRPLLAGVKPTSLAPEPEKVLEVAAAVDAGLALVPVAPTCLRRSVTLIRELNRLRLAATLHIGVREVGGNVEAHAWVQAGEVVVNDDPDLTDTYVEMAAGELENLLPNLR